jgi:CrcB protein
MKDMILVVIGGAVGTLFRYLVTGVGFRTEEGVFPFGTLVVNVTGSLIIGFLWGFFERFDVSSSVRMTLFVGVLGGYTTFSAFGLESLNLARSGELRTAFTYIVATNLLGLASVFAGFKASRIL